MRRALPRCCEWHRSLREFCNAISDREDSRRWVAGVKRRLGLVEPGDRVPARMEQWDADHPPGDPLTAFCAKGRELDTALTLELYDERVAEVRGQAWLTGTEAWLWLARAPDACGDLAALLASMIEPIPWPLKSYKCPGCTVQCFAGIFEPSVHFSFCHIAHPPLPPLNIGGLIGGIGI